MPFELDQNFKLLLVISRFCQRVLKLTSSKAPRQAFSVRGLISKLLKGTLKRVAPPTLNRAAANAKTAAV